MPDRFKVVAEFGGTAFLLAIVVGSGVMGERLSGGNTAIALLANSIATGAGLFALIAALQAVSGAHFNPVVTTLAVWRRQLGWRLAIAYVCAQFAGAVVGVVAAHAMFGLPIIQAGGADRSAAGMIFAEFVATTGLLAAISLSSSRNAAAVVAAFITAAYWFTSSTSFANPAVTTARALTATFAGIAWHSVPAFVLAQLAALVTAGCICAFNRESHGGTQD